MTRIIRISASASPSMPPPTPGARRCAVARPGRWGERGLVLACLAGLLVGQTGCAAWTPAQPKPLEHVWLQATMQMPDDWMVATFSEGLFTTRHGLELESIHVRRWPRTTEVKGTGRSIEDGLLPAEVAEISLDSRRLDDGVGGLEVISNAPASVDGRDCYRIDYRFREESGLPIRTVETGCVVDTWIYRFEYRAAEQHYFDAGLPAYEALVSSVDFWIE